VCLYRLGVLRGIRKDKGKLRWSKPPFYSCQHTTINMVALQSQTKRSCLPPMLLICLLLINLVKFVAASAVVHSEDASASSHAYPYDNTNAHFRNGTTFLPWYEDFVTLPSNGKHSSFICASQDIKIKTHRLRLFLFFRIHKSTVARNGLVRAYQSQCQKHSCCYLFYTTDKFII
jgi:hypothetical protein